MGSRSSKELSLHGDLAISFAKDDEFGLSAISKEIAKLLARKDLPPGYTVGLQGAWGSGKSSLAELTALELNRLSGDLEVVRFNPWQIANREHYAGLLLGEISRGVNSYVERHRSTLNAAALKTLDGLVELIRYLGRMSAALGTTATYLSVFDPTQKTKLAALGLKKAGKWLKNLRKEPTKTFAETRREIFQTLDNLRKNGSNLKLAVIVDDTDRLEPAEAAEVLRALREVANFPLISYLVCFDHNILNRQLESALGLAADHRYTDKLFNQIVPVPPQEPFALRRYFQRLIAPCIPEMDDKLGTSGDSGVRMHYLFNSWVSSLLRTPRDVVRVADAIRIGWPSLPRDSDFWDYCWLQVIKLKAPKLYDFVAEYVSNIGAYRDGGAVTDTTQVKDAARLAEILTTIDFDKRHYASGLDKFLPGLDAHYGPNEVPKLYSFNSTKLAIFEREKRLGSPSHWRQYFSFSLPTYAITDQQISNFRKQVETAPIKASATLLEFVKTDREDPTMLVEVLLDRLLNLPEGALSKREQTNLPQVMGAAMDEVFTLSGQQPSGFNSVWSTSIRLLRKCNTKDFEAVVKKGESLSWIAQVLRHQGFAHGKPEATRADKNEQWLTEGQLTQFVSSAIKRFKTTDFRRLVSCPSTPDIFYLWYQLGNKDALVRHIAQNTRSDDMLLTTLEQIRGVSISETGLTRPLYAQTVATFFGEKNIKSKLDGIQASLDTPYSDRAKALLASWKDKFI